MEHSLEVIRICVRAYMRHIRMINDDVRVIAERISEIRTTVELTGVSFDSQGSASSTGDKMADGVARLVQMSEEFSLAIDRLDSEYKTAFLWCQPENVGCYAVWLHDVEGMQWRIVGELTGYSEKHIPRIADKGYRELYDLIPEEYRRSSIPNALA